ncbi:DUF1648 domain-containing protein [Paenibacillus dakarensis]|uniref:DUF1648 domain-containing protein n=1 Tax=Paenibacillus dakarensis TaxID=1527293 RepID=UPI0006D54072|nr:DUF5808 domain-containing protein [Paenibacillus dakarensis]
MYVISALIIGLMILPLLASLAFMPYFTRETLSFGITVSEETFHSEPLRKLRRQYAGINSLVSILLIVCCLLVVSLWPEEVSKEIAFTFTILGIVLFSLMMNVIFHLKMKRIKSNLPTSHDKRQTLSIDTRFRQQKLVFSNIWFILHGIIAAISATWTLSYYDRIPGQLPMKFDFEGHVTRFADKSVLTVLFPNIMQVVMIVIFAFVNWSILNSKQQIGPGDPAESAARNAIFRRRWSFFNMTASFIIILLFSFIQFNMILSFNTDMLILVSMLTPVLIIIGVLVLTLTTGQGGSRIGPKRAPSSAQPYDDDAYWKLGGIYFNPHDPAIFVEKRFGVGWTINYANKKAWAVMIGLISLILAASLLSA